MSANGPNFKYKFTSRVDLYAGVTMSQEALGIPQPQEEQESMFGSKAYRQLQISQISVPSVSQEYLIETSEAVERGIKSVLKGTECSYKALETGTRLLCGYNQAKEFKAQLDAGIKAHCQSITVNAIDNILDEWDFYYAQLCLLSKIVAVVDVQYNLGAPTKRVGIHHFGKHVLQIGAHGETPVRYMELFLCTVLKNLRTRGDNDLGGYDALTVERIYKMFTVLGTFDQVFSLLIQVTREYYEDFVLVFTGSSLDYLGACVVAESIEFTVLQNLMPCTTTQKMQAAAIEVLVAGQLPRLLAALPSLLRGPDYKRLSNLYDLLRRANQVSALRDDFTIWIRQKGVGIVEDLSGRSCAEVVAKLVEFRTHLTEVTKNCFYSDSSIVECLRNAFPEFVNLPEMNIAEYIVQYANELLSSITTSDEVRLQHEFDHIIFFFRCLSNKLYFAERYHYLFAKRLSSGKSTSIDAEKQMLMLLEHECGKEFVGKAECMFADYTASKDLNSRFKYPNFDMRVMVCDSATWPSLIAQPAVVWPRELLHAKTKFETFFAKANKSKTLAWNIDCSTVILKYKPYEREIEATLAQGILLLAIKENIKVGELRVKTNLPFVDEILQSLQSLITMSGPQTLPIPDNYRINLKAPARGSRILRLPPVQHGDQTVEVAVATARARSTRVANLNAIIAHIIKPIKQASLSVIKQKVEQRCRVAIEDVDFCAALDNLEKNGFIKRDGRHGETLHYVP